MKIPPNSLMDFFKEVVLSCYSSEQKYARLFSQFSDLAITEELSSSLSPARNESEQFVERLGLILKLLKLRASRIVAPEDEVLLTLGKDACGYKKQQSVHKDLQLIHISKLIAFHQIAVYSSLEQMAQALKLNEASQLLNATLSDKKNAAAYFTQIEQNILYPAAVKQDKGN